MKFSEFIKTKQGEATQIVIAAALNIHGVEITNDDVDIAASWLKEANDLDPDPLDTAGAGIVIAKDLVEKTEKNWDNVVVSKVEQIYTVLIDITKNGFGRVWDMIKIAFQSKRKSLKKLD